MRDEAAARRDRMAAERDGAARARDELAASLRRRDRASRAATAAARTAARRSASRSCCARRAIASVPPRAGPRRRCTARRPRATASCAADDRHQAAHDRAEAAAEFALEGVDPLTGALLRRGGAPTIQRELDRTRRTGERLLVAFVDVDGLKRVNDGAATRRVTSCCVRSPVDHPHLRSYDVSCGRRRRVRVLAVGRGRADGALSASPDRRPSGRGGRRHVHGRLRGEIAGDSLDELIAPCRRGDDQGRQRRPQRVSHKVIA